MNSSASDLSFDWSLQEKLKLEKGIDIDGRDATQKSGCEWRRGRLLCECSSEEPCWRPRAADASRDSEEVVGWRMHPETSEFINGWSSAGRETGHCGGAQTSWYHDRKLCKDGWSCGCCTFMRCISSRSSNIWSFAGCSGEGRFRAFQMAQGSICRSFGDQGVPLSLWRSIPWIRWSEGTFVSCTSARSFSGTHRGLQFWSRSWYHLYSPSQVFYRGLSDCNKILLAIVTIVTSFPHSSLI